MSIERVCVIGAGAIGSLYAGHLAAVADVQVLTRREAHAHALNEEGLRVSGKSERHARLRASADAGDLDDFDLGIICTKAPDLEQTAARLEGRFPAATMMTIQNGLGAEELLRRHGSWKLISAVTFMSGHRHGDAHVEYELDTATWLGPYAEGGATYELARQICDLLLSSGLVAEAMPDLRPAQWSKLLFNSAVNAVAALTDLPHVREFAGEREPADLGHLVHDLIDEGRRVAQAAGIELHEDPWEMNVRAVSVGETQHGEYAHLPSMLEDVRARRRTEIDSITGAVAREGMRVGVPTPLHTALWRLVRGMELSWERNAAAPREEARA